MAMIRYNHKGEFNVPFGKKIGRFSKAYITKIVNQVTQLAQAIREREWVFRHANWREVVGEATSEDFVYADPPYVGRHTDYYSRWDAEDSEELLTALRMLDCGFALSSWKENRYRQNPLLPDETADIAIRTTHHFYHLGPTENLRNAMEEALVLKRSFAANSGETVKTP